MRRLVGVASAAVVDLAALECARPRFGELARGLRAPHAWLREAGADHALVVLASTATWCAAVWLGCALVALAATALPGAFGRQAQRVSRRLLPGALHRLLAGSAGLSILVAPVAAGAATHHAGYVPPGVGTGALPSPTWPVDPPTSSLPAPHWPATPTAGPPAAPAADPPAHPRAGQRDEIRVRAGDSLWAIAARRLGPDATPDRIARAWPQWYATNLPVIGADPDLIRPGELLHAPKDSS